MAILKLKNIDFIADNTEILKSVNLKINNGDCISIVGPSGSGKSTLLKLCSDLLPPTSGNIIFNDTDYSHLDPINLRRKISYCVQSPILFGNTVYDNLVFPFSIRKEHFNKEKVITLLQNFNLSEEYLNKDITTLSGGEKQRIALIRNIIFPPQILLLDEATSALDKENCENIENIVGNLNKSGVTVLWITHSMSQSLGIFNKRITLENGKICCVEELK